MVPKVCDSSLMLFEDLLIYLDNYVIRGPGVA